MSTRPSLDRSLAYVALSKRHRWLGSASPQSLNVFLAGAAVRVSLSGARLATWRLYGPLEDPEFYLPIVAETGHPSLSVRWATAMELLHFSLEDAARDLMRRMRAFVRARGFDTTLVATPHRSMSLADWFGSMARLPGMYLGSNSGWDLRC